jgi:hypothetical protein
MPDNPLRAMRLRSFGLSLCACAAGLLIVAIVLMLRGGGRSAIMLTVVGLALNVVGFVLLQRGKKAAGGGDA